MGSIFFEKKSDETIMLSTPVILSPMRIGTAKINDTVSMDKKTLDSETKYFPLAAALNYSYILFEAHYFAAASLKYASILCLNTGIRTPDSIKPSNVRTIPLNAACAQNFMFRMYAPARVPPFCAKF